MHMTSMIMVHGHVLDVQYVYLQISSGRCFSVFWPISSEEVCEELRAWHWQLPGMVITLW